MTCNMKTCNLEYGANLHIICWDHHSIQEMDEDMTPPQPLKL